MPCGVPPETLEPSHKEILRLGSGQAAAAVDPLVGADVSAVGGDMRRAVTTSCRDLTAMGARAARSSLALLTPSTGRDLRAFSDADVLGQDSAAVTLDAAAE